MNEGIGHDQARHDEERRARDVARHVESDGVEGGPALDGDGGALDFDGHAERGQEALGVVAGGRGLHDGGAAFRLERGQQHRGFHLGAGRGHGPRHGLQRTAFDHERRPALGRGEAGPHHPERLGHPFDGPPAQGSVAGEHGPERPRRHHPRQHAQRRSRVRGIERGGRRPQALRPAADDHDRAILVPRLDAERFQASQRRRAIVRRREIGQAALAMGERAQDGQAVGEGFVSGEGEPATEMSCLGDPHGALTEADDRTTSRRKYRACRVLTDLWCHATVPLP